MFQGTQLDGKPGMPSKPMIMNMLVKLKDAGVLKVLGSASVGLTLSQVLAAFDGTDFNWGLERRRYWPLPDHVEQWHPENTR